MSVGEVIAVAAREDATLAGLRFASPEPEWYAAGHAMHLTAGTRLGVYEIRSLLGAGGMGEVYRARDTKLNRDVAIKILSGAYATDPDRLARFDREAQLLASLNHPGIAQIPPARGRR